MARNVGPVEILAAVLVLGGLIWYGTRSHEDAAPAAPAPVAAPAPSAQQRAAEAAKDAAAKADLDRKVFASMGQRTLKGMLRDPDSYQLMHAVLAADGSACYQFRAKNGFGGYDIGQAVAVTSTQHVLLNDAAGFTEAWQAHCAQGGEDVTRDIGPLF